ncbi:MAG TPA: amidohydrolase family protein [Candidatus Scybalosoma faecavium]|nr:amidohydrolase family protein [Candidatus Scybalosoma faecavium]
MGERMTEIYKADIVYAPTLDLLEEIESGYIVVRNGEIEGVYDTLPEKYDKEKITELGGLLIPGMTDMHVHAPQYALRGVGFDLELLDWLDRYTFPGEAKFADEAFAKEIYSAFAKELVRKGTTRAVVFATVHVPATMILMDELEKAGIEAYVGKVNMDRNAPDSLRESNSVMSTLEWLEECSRRDYRSVKPIITPRFVPSCTGELMDALGKIAEERGLPVQSHLSENISEIELVKKLHPESEVYADVYAAHGLWNERTVMAHCVHSDDREIELIKKAGVTVAHCPDSNTNVSSGAAHVRELLSRGVKLGLGSDIAGGSKLCMLDVMAEAIKVSKLRYVLCRKKDRCLTISEVLHMATNADFFGEKAGFLPGAPFHAVLLDDSHLVNTDALSLADRLERMMYLSDERKITAVWARGKKIL